MLGVGTGYVQFVPCQAVVVVQHPDHLEVILDGVAENVGEYSGLIAPQ